MPARACFRYLLGLIGLVLLGCPAALGQSPDMPPSLAQRLGYDAEAKLLIIHTDDVGVAHSVNAASLDAFAKGFVNSGSVMVPCPWFPEIAAHARENPDHDLGLHLTLTSEWRDYRWGPVLPIAEVPTLVNEQGFLYATTPEAVRHIDPREAEAEIRAQVERALAFGLQPTHLDSHMGVLFQTPELFEAYLRVGRAYKLPVLIPGGAMLQQAPHLASLLTPDDLVIDHLAMATPQVPAENWEAFYTGILENLQPGITEIIIHVGFDDAELRAVTIDHPDYGAAWRQRDFDVFTNPALQRLLDEHNIQLITWREIGTLLKP